MDTTHCINNNTWELYAINKLSPQELAALQKHANTCELCSDIKEGIDAMAQPKDLPQTVESLNKRVDESLASKQRRKTIPIWYWSAAAVLLITLTIGFLYTKNSSNGIALTETKKEETIAIDTLQKTRDTKEKTKPSTGTKSETIDKKETINSPEFKNESLGKKEISKDNLKKEATTKEKPLAPILNDENLLEKDMVIEVDTSTPLKRGSVTKTTTKEITKGTERSKLTLPSPQMNNMFNNRNYNDINSNLGMFNFKHASDSLSYSIALTYYNQDSLKRCTESLSQIINNANSLFYEEALLLQAKTYIKQQQKEDAKALLKKVISIKGKHRREAKKLLKKLRK